MRVACEVSKSGGRNAVLLAGGLIQTGYCLRGASDYSVNKALGECLEMGRAEPAAGEWRAGCHAEAWSGLWGRVREMGLQGQDRPDCGKP